MKFSLSVLTYFFLMSDRNGHLGYTVLKQKDVIGVIGGTQIFHCNYDAKCINLDKSLPKFYTDVMFYW